MEPKLVLTFSLLISAAVASDYIRPPPRETLDFPWSSKASSHPQQVHLSLAGEKQMRVSWITDDKSAPSIVDYGTSPGRYTGTSQGQSTSYKYLFYSSGKIHHTVIGPLEPDTLYYYQCGGQGPEFQFKTPPAQFPVTFAVAGDLGQTGWTKSTLDHINQCKYDLHLLPGDLSYADYMQHRWDTFGELVEPLASARPWMVTQGGGCHLRRVDQVQIFIIPLRLRELILSCLVHMLIIISTQNNITGSCCAMHIDAHRDKHVAQTLRVVGCTFDSYRGEQSSKLYPQVIEFHLSADLAKVDRKKTPWLLVLFHVPWYNSNMAHQGEGNSMMEAMEPLLYAASVDIVLAGHVHAYERSKRVSNGRLDPCGAIHITIGDGGNREGLAHRYIEPQPEWSVFREASFGHGELKLVNSTHAFWSWHRNDDDEPVRSDEVWITLVNSGCIAERNLN